MSFNEHEVYESKDSTIAFIKINGISNPIIGFTINLLPTWIREFNNYF